MENATGKTVVQSGFMVAIIAAWLAFAGFIPWLAATGLALVETVAVMVGTVAGAFASYIRQATDEPHEQFLAGLAAVAGLLLLDGLLSPERQTT